MIQMMRNGAIPVPLCFPGKRQLSGVHVGGRYASTGNHIRCRPWSGRFRPLNLSILQLLLLTLPHTMLTVWFITGKGYCMN